MADSANAAATHGGHAPDDSSGGSGDDDDAGGDGKVGGELQFCRSQAMPIGEIDYPLLRAVIAATAKKIVAGGGPGQIADAVTISGVIPAAW